MDTIERRTRFRAVLAGDRCVVPASVFDAVSGNLAEDLGYEIGVMMGGYSALAAFGVPDINLVTMNEVAEQCYRVCRRSKLPLVVDIDHGFGNALNTMRTVEELERAGAAAVLVEDTVIPAPYGESGKPRLTGLDEAVGRMRAAVAGRSDPQFAVFGRTMALSVAGLEETITRAKAFEAAGVDGVWIAPRSREQIDALAEAVSLPLMVPGLTRDLADLDYLASRRVRIASLAHPGAFGLAYAAAVKAIYETMRALREGVLPDDIPNVASQELMRRAIRADDYDRWADEFL